MSAYEYFFKSIPDYIKEIDTFKRATDYAIKYIREEDTEDDTDYLNSMSDRLLFNCYEYLRNDFLDLIESRPFNYPKFKAFIDKNFRKCEHCGSYEPDEFFLNPIKDNFSVYSDCYCFECNDYALDNYADDKRAIPILHSQDYLTDEEALKGLKEIGYSLDEAKELLLID